jgi:hypothetical protein
MSFQNHITMINCDDLIHKLADVLFSIFVPRWENKNSDGGKKSDDNSGEIDFATNIDDALSLFERLQFGIDVNVKFSGVNEFEYTRELDVFDLFDISLYHGWLVDPQSDLYQSFANKSYNQLVEISLNDTPETLESDLVAEITSDRPGSSKQMSKTCLSLLARQFLDESASQLTYYGLIELQARLKSNELAILFRNNHFSVIYKQSTDDRLYLLVTDQGYQNHKDIIWETLGNYNSVFK